MTTKEEAQEAARKCINWNGVTLGKKLKPCPFCNGEAEFERVGTNRQSCIVHCTECGARLESNETFSSGEAWNRGRVKKEEVVNTEKKPKTTKQPSALSYFNSGLFMVFVGIALLEYFNTRAFWLCFGGTCMFFVAALCKANKNVKEGKHMYE